MTEEELIRYLDYVNTETHLFEKELTGVRLNKEFVEDKLYEIGEYSFKLTWGATRLVIIPQEKFLDYVIKVPFHNKKDYCNIETNLYNLAVKEGLELFFAAEEYVCDYSSNHIYIQERAEIDYDYCIDIMRDYYLVHYDEDDYYEQDEYLNFDDYVMSLASRDGYQPLDSLLIGLFDADDQYKMLYDFIKDNQINDLHYANIGFRDGLPLFIDYSGYNT